MNLHLQIPGTQSTLLMNAQVADSLFDSAGSAPMSHQGNAPAMYEPEIIFRSDKETNPMVDVVVRGVGGSLESPFTQTASDFISVLFITNQHDAVISMGTFINAMIRCTYAHRTPPRP